jgi:hypothetical protein
MNYPLSHEQNCYLSYANTLNGLIGFEGEQLWIQNGNYSIKTPVMARINIVSARLSSINFMLTDKNI